MVLFNYSTKELTAKIVYYGPGLCGKTSNLHYVHQNLPDTIRGKMLSLATKTDRTLFFDFLPMDLGEIRGMKTRMQLYTVPGQVFYNETRKLVLKGADGIVFVADSQKEMLGANIESFKNLEENLKAHGLKLAETPHVIQFNKRDLPKLSSVEELNAAINRYNAPFYESVATSGIGVHDTLKAITKLVLLHLTKKYESRAVTEEAPQPETAPAAAAIPVAAAAAAPSASAMSSKGKRRTGREPVRPAREKPQPVAQSAYAAASASIAAVADEEIDDLIGEVAETASPTGPAATAAAPQGETGHIAVTLTDIATDPELFDDPSLEVAELAVGEAREILIPVQLGEPGPSMRRFKLSVTLRLERIQGR